MSRVPANLEDSIRESIITMYQSGITVQDIANEIEGATPGYVRAVLREAGILAGPGRRDSLVDKFDDATLEAMMLDYYQDMPMPEILVKYRLARHEQFYRILASIGHGARKIQPEVVMSRKDRDERALELYKQGAPIWKIRDETGIPQPRLHYLVHTRKIPLRRSK